ncbi:MAG TPA: FAD-dependent oxidoreductase [Tepidisphaeraceae bacterium]|nr:FAD-dependent oxidoreductase [Tepidisphaeraceae bacterium]
MPNRIAIGVVLIGLALSAGAQEKLSVDVAVYGGTPGGIAAARAAARGGAAVLLIEPTRHVGGLTTSGLSHTDFRTYEGLTGEFLTFSRAVEAYYRDKYGANSEQVKECRRGTHAEPHVNELVFDRLLAEGGKIAVRKELALRDVAVVKAGEVGRIESATFAGDGGGTVAVAAKVFIDATYEGDLMAKAGVKYRVGREGKDEYGESLAPDAADAQLQAYNFRLVMTPDPRLKVDVKQPAGYRREEFADVVPLLGKQIKRTFGYPGACVFKAQIPLIPNGKYDINDVSGGLVRLSMPGENLEWPEGTPAARRTVFDRHLAYNVGLLWFIQNDPAVPERFRNEARDWGWCKDEFVDNGHLPYQLYVREARRMVGRHVFTERDTANAPGDARTVHHPQAIATGDYGPNCHGTSHEGPRYGGKHTGEFYKHVPPYQVPYGSLVPNEVGNLLVPVAASSSHVGFCALRLEPVWMSLGEAAGTAARVAVEGKTDVRSVDVARVQALLHAGGAATVYVSDVPRESELFRAVQWLGARGGLHGLNPPPPGGPRGKNIEGQYYQAFPGHAFEAEKVSEMALVEKWVGLMSEGRRAAAKAESATWDGWTRGKVAGRLYEIAHP